MWSIVNVCISLRQSNENTIHNICTVELFLAVWLRNTLISGSITKIIWWHQNGFLLDCQSLGVHLNTGISMKDFPQKPEIPWHMILQNGDMHMRVWASGITKFLLCEIAKISLIKHLLQHPEIDGS